MTTYRTAIIGPEELISGFRALGVDTYSAENGSALLATLLRLRRGGGDDATEGVRYAVVIAIEALVAELPSEEWEKVARGVLPAVVVLPGIEGSTGEGVRKLKKLAERAIGSDILG
jgi:V/A-type H+-transporting ATPase subunit F